jgi:exodeoxyribonuclease V beta subunit
MQRHALAIGQAIPAPALLENEAALRLQVCEEFWRQASRDPLNASALDQEFSNPEAMAGKLPELLSPAVLMPPASAPGAPPDAAAALDALRASHAQHHAEALALMLEAYHSGALNGNSFRSEDSIRRPFEQLAAYLRCPDEANPPRFDSIAYSRIKEKKNKPKPDNPLLRALDDWNAHVDACVHQRGQRQLALHHALRTFARERLGVLKKQQNLIGFDDIINTVYDALNNDDGRLAEAIQASWPVALVDEFQDTDSRQWCIFECLYRRHGAGTLTLIGDPKQAIYGFRGGDIHTYLAVQKLADRHESLADNFRSSAALLAGIETLFLARHAHPFLEDGVAFQPVRAGRPGHSLCIDGDTPPAVGLLALPQPDDGKLLGISAARQQAAEICADAICTLLQQGSAGRALVADQHRQRPLRIDDIAVLVHTHSEAALMQSRLLSRGVASVCVRRDSIFSSYAALDLLAILRYLIEPTAFRAEQTAGLGLLWRAASLAGDMPSWPDSAERLIRQGPLAALMPLLMRARPVLMQQNEGERIVRDYAQLIELLQGCYLPNADSRHCFDWLDRQIMLSENSAASEAVAPYLESSLPRLRIMTIHQSKGLEFGYVFLPFTAIRQQGRRPVYARYVEDGHRCLFLTSQTPDPAISALVEREQRSEALRLLYVGMTRAKFGLRATWGRVKSFEDTALGHLLGPDTPDGGMLLMAPAAPGRAPEPTPPTPPAPLPTPIRQPASWQISSFSGWHQSHEAAYRQPADDEAGAPSITTERDPFAGADFGNALHSVLEHCRPQDWRTISMQALDQCTQALLQYGYPLKMAEIGSSKLAALVQACLQARLPEGLALADIADSDKRHEMEFHLRLRHASSSRVLELLHRHGYCRQRTQLGFQNTLNGLLTGKIDLLYRHAGKIHIVDYKSNSLAAYDDAALQGAIREREYDLQYLLYTIAVQRWLRLRMPAFDYRRHFGGVRYLFARGIEAASPGRGVFQDYPDPALIAALDACFDGEDIGNG